MFSRWESTSLYYFAVEQKIYCVDKQKVFKSLSRTFKWKYLYKNKTLNNSRKYIMSFFSSLRDFELNKNWKYGHNIIINDIKNRKFIHKLLKIVFLMHTASPFKHISISTSIPPTNFLQILHQIKLHWPPSFHITCQTAATHPQNLEIVHACENFRFYAPPPYQLTIFSWSAVTIANRCKILTNKINTKQASMTN